MSLYRQWRHKCLHSIGAIGDFRLSCSTAEQQRFRVMKPSDHGFFLHFHEGNKAIMTYENPFNESCNINNMLKAME